MKIATKHPNYPRHLVRRAAAWVAGEIGLESRHRKPLTIEVGYRRSNRGGWGGWYRHGRRLVQVLLPKVPITYPSSMAHNQAEREQGFEARDEFEIFVGMLAHELEHARAYATATHWQDLARLNCEPRVRAVHWRVVLAFRDKREQLLADWGREPAPRPARPVVSLAERRQQRAVKMLAAWERRAKLAKTKVAKYRRKVAYYERSAATRRGTA